MNDNINNMNNNENEEIKKEDNIETKDITREINLDDLYDGAINNTVVLDPVTNDEILVAPKKRNYTFLGIFLSIIILLSLYVIYNKTSLVNKPHEVKPVTTTVMKKVSNNDSGILSCSYQSKSDSESSNAKYIANFENSKLLSSTFEYTVVSLASNITTTVSDLQTQYENFYINNASVKGITTTFDKNAKGFTFISEIKYNNADFNSLKIEDGKTILYIKPDKDDNYNDLKEEYTKNGFNCTILNVDEVD